MLDLEFTPEQDMLRETVRKVCATYSPLSVVRELEDDPSATPPTCGSRWPSSTSSGSCSPRSTAARAWAPSKVWCSTRSWAAPSPPRRISPAPCCAARRWPRRARRHSRRSGWRLIAAGEAIVTPAWFEPENSCGPTGIQMRAEPDGDGYRLTGTKRHVPFASSASAFVVLARTGDAPGDVDLFLVDPATDGVTLDQQLTVASDTQFQVTFDGVRVGRRGPHRRRRGRGGRRGTP